MLLYLKTSDSLLIVVSDSVFTATRYNGAHCYILLQVWTVATRLAARMGYLRHVEVIGFDFQTESNSPWALLDDRVEYISTYYCLYPCIGRVRIVSVLAANLPRCNRIERSIYEIVKHLSARLPSDLFVYSQNSSRESLKYLAWISTIVVQWKFDTAWISAA